MTSVRVLAHCTWTEAPIPVELAVRQEGKLKNLNSTHINTANQAAAPTSLEQLCATRKLQRFKHPFPENQKTKLVILRPFVVKLYSFSSFLLSHPTLTHLFTLPTMCHCFPSCITWGFGPNSSVTLPVPPQHHFCHCQMLGKSLRSCQVNIALVYIKFNIFSFRLPFFFWSVLPHLESHNALQGKFRHSYAFMADQQ